MFDFSESRVFSFINKIFKTTLVLFLAFSVCLHSTDFSFAKSIEEHHSNTLQYEIKFSNSIDKDDIENIFVKYYDEASNHERYVKLSPEKDSDELLFEIESEKCVILEVSLHLSKQCDYLNLEYFELYKLDNNGNKELIGQISNLTKYGINIDSSEKVYNFKLNNSEEKSKEEANDIASHYFTMDWETANSDLGLGKDIAKYIVNLKVSPNQDAGSCNHFYFQLVFKSGYSAYVLANNYVPNDKFYPGHTYSIEVSTNEDMGEVIAVNVIPDTKYANKDIKDDLILDEINVIKINDNGVNNKYSILNVDNLGFSNASQNTNSFYLVTLPVDYSSECLCFEVSLTSSRYFNSTQFEGTMLLDIGYKDIYGNDTVISNFDVVHAIYDYQGCRNPKFTDGKYVSDPETMFKGDLTDRFFIFLDNAKSLNYMNFRSYSTNDSSWDIKNISVGMVDSGYSLHKNVLGEYQNKYDNESGTLLLVDKYTKVPNAEPGSLYVTFSENEIPEIVNSEINNVVPRIPDSTNDKLNIFVYLDRDSTNPNTNNFSMFGEVFYQGTYRSYSNKIKFNVAPTMDGGLLLYAYGVNASGFVSLSNMIVSSDVKRTKENDFADTINYAIIEQLRHSTIVDKYTLQYDHADVMLTGSCSMISAGNSKQDNEYQEVGLSFLEGSSSANLDPMNHDIAVSLKYTSKNDVSGLNTVYSSPYIYLTDQGIKSIKAGETVNLKFREGFVDKIVGIELITTGGINAILDTGYIVTYEEDGAVTTGWYGIPDGGAVALGGTLFDVSENSESVKPVDITFVTNETSQPVSVSICYLDKNGNIQYKDIPNNMEFENQTETTLSVLLPNLKEIRSITIEPNDSIYVEDVTTSVQNAGGIDSRTVKVEKDIYFGSPYTINMSNIIVKLSIEAGDIKTKIENGTIDLTLKEGDKVEILPEIIGSMEGFGYNSVIELIRTDESGTTIKNLDSSSSSKLKGTVDFKVPKTEENESYKITISSTENKAIKSTVNVYVKEE